MRPNSSQTLKRKGKTFRFQNIVLYMKNYGYKCRRFYELTMTT
jgi:hypothetical protein